MATLERRLTVGWRRGAVPRFGWSAVVACALATEALLVLLTVLLVNVPAGYTSPLGFSLDSVELFRAAFAYPVVDLAPGGFTAAVIGAFAGLGLLYAAVLAVVARSYWGGQRGVALVLGPAVLFHLTLAIWTPPVLSADIFQYVMNGRMVVLHGLNPYLTLPTAIADDPVVSHVFSRGVGTHYGPFWTLVSAAVVALTGQSVLAATVAFKGLAAVTNLVSAWLVWRLSRELTGSRSLLPLAACAWNPLFLLESAASGHNDVEMMTLALAGLLFAARRRLVLAAVCLTLSVLVKYLTALLAVFFAVWVLRQAGGWRPALSTIARLGAAVLATLAVCFAPFWSGPAGFAGILFHATEAPAASFVRALLQEGVAAALAGGGDPAPFRHDANTIVSRVLYGLFALLVLWCVKVAADRRATLARVAELWSVTGLVFVAVVYSWIFPWYLIGPAATALATPPSPTTRRVRVWLVCLGVLLLLLYAVLSPLPEAAAG